MTPKTSLATHKNSIYTLLQAIAVPCALIFLLIALAPVVAYAGQAPSAPHQNGERRKIPDMKMYGPAVPQELDGAFWRTDAGFQSTIRITNIVQTAPIQVTPVLLMADGTEYALPVVELQAAGVATVSINDALNHAPAKIAPHVSSFGSATLRFHWPWASAISGTIRSLDVQRSLTYSNAFQLSMATNASNRERKTGAGGKSRVISHQKPVDMSPQAVTMEGLWWKRDPQDAGFVVLTNRSERQIPVAVKVFASGEKEFNTSVLLLPHQTQQVALKEAFDGFPNGAKSGGIRIQYQGVKGSILATGGIENVAVGYSAKVPFGYVPSADNKLISWTIASVGIMHGPPDPMMQFPAETRFTSYAVLRNISAQPLQVAPTAYVTPGQQATTTKVKDQTLQLPALVLKAGETASLDLEGALNSNGFKNVNAGLTLSLAMNGVSGGLVAAIGSVDQSGDYVFEVEPHPVSSSLSKNICFFEVGNGTDTMVSLWNHNDHEEDLLVTLFFQGGHYKMPVHLAAKRSAMFNVLEIIKARTPDADGNTIPASTTRGSIVVSGPQEDTQTIDVSLNAATYSVRGATCDPICQQCEGFFGMVIDPGSFSLPVGGSQAAEAIGNYTNGQQYYMSAQWSSSDTSVATSSNATVTAVGAGLADITAFMGNIPTEGRACLGMDDMNGNPESCPIMSDMSANAPVTGTPDHLVVTSDVTSVLCTTNNTLRRIISYSEVDVNGNSVGTISTKEKFDSKGANSCSNNVSTSETCSPDAGGVFQDALTVGCNSVGGSCGFTYTKQKWLYCPPTGAPVVFAAPGDLVVHNNSITVGGDASFPAGTKIGKTGIIP